MTFQVLNTSELGHVIEKYSAKYKQWSVNSFDNFPIFRSKKLRIFEKTGPIPTHMVTYAIFNRAFQSIQSMNKYFIWTIEEFINESNYPLNVLTSVAEKMSEIFANVAYKPRIDLVIVVHPKMWIQSRENPWGSMLYV